VRVSVQDAAMKAAIALPPTMTVLERGWLSSNSIVFDDGAAVSIVDTGYVSHAAQTLALVDRLRASSGDSRPLNRIVNTHLHSDHVGGNALLKAHFAAAGCTIAMPAGLAAAVADWDEDALTYGPTGQRCERFMYDRLLADGDTLVLGGLRWEVLAAPGHDPHMVMLLNVEHGILISADALWEHGFGAIFPEIEGESGFAEQRAALQLIARHAPRIVIPGHGAPFTDVGAALNRAHARLDALAGDPARNARQVARVLIKFWLLDQRRATLDALIAHFSQARYLTLINARYFHLPFDEFMRRTVDELAAIGAVAVVDGDVQNLD
jgi:glyoxylase-like metal-dependent hydrolase (beta-lactamase superfamily II)